MKFETLARKGSFLATIFDDFDDKTSFEGSTIETLTSQFGLHMLINEPIHLLQNSSSCIELIFTSQANIVVESGVH